MPEIAKYTQIFDYLSSPEVPISPEPAVAFGRQDPLVAKKLGDLIIPGLVETVVITGGIGKDSGNLLAEGYSSEADFLRKALLADAVARNYTLPQVQLDEKASNGGENARNSLDILQKQEYSLISLTAVTHATSLRRLSETIAFEAHKKAGKALKVHRVPTDYSFDATNPDDRNEAAAELLRLADWPGRNMLHEQLDLPENLVDFVRDKHGDAPRPVRPWQSTILRTLPKSLQLRVIKLAAKHGRK
jgi:hypothetical protein